MSNAEPHFIMHAIHSKPTKPLFINNLKNAFFYYKLSSLRLTPLVLAMGLLPQQAWSETATSICEPDLIAAQQQIPAKNAKQEKNFTADKLSQPSKEQYLLEGNAVVKQPGLVVLSDEALYNKTDNIAVFTGNVELHSPEMTVKAKHATLDNNQSKALLTETQFQLLPSRAHGFSDDIQVDDAAKLTTLAKASLTKCRVKTDQSVDWDLKFEKLEINDKTRRVVGRNSTLYFKGVPVFYTPYFDYPLDDRASGLLFPEVGSYKSLNQAEPSKYVKIPYYFNIATNMDDTLTAIPMTERGLILDNEFRYMAEHNDVQHNAEISITGLQDAVTDTNRWRATIDAKQNWGQGFSSSLLWDDVSDLDFYADIPVNKDFKAATLKQRLAQLDYHNGSLHAYVQMLSYLQLQNTSYNYEKRPEFGLIYSKQLNDFNLSLNATSTEFAVPTSGHSRPEAMRINIAPTLTHSLENSYGHLTTTLVANQTQYQMKDNGFNPSSENTINRFVPQFAVRGGLVFERDLNWNEQTYIQTLEPEIQYLYIPYTEQSGIELFDTGYNSVSFSNLFALNRFTGSDRIGDTNQISTALTTKLLNEKGETLAETGVGQIAYLEDRKVALSGNTPETAKTSDIFIKLGISTNNWYFSSTAQLDRQDQHITHANTRLKWQKNDDTFLINHTLLKQGTASETENTSFGGYTNIYNNWDIGFYGNYDMLNDEFYNKQIGLRYDSCCWSAEIIAERTQLQNGLYNNGIQVQFELKGLSTSGTRFRQDLTNKLNF